MIKNKLKIYLDDCTRSLDNISKEPLKNLEESLLYLDSLEKFLNQNNFPYLLEKTKNLSNILFTIKHFLEQTKYLDPNLMEELAFFLKGAFMDLSSHIDGMEDKDLEFLKNEHWQKILFLNDWVKEFLKLPEQTTSRKKEQYEKFLIFALEKDHFTIPINSFKEILLLERQEDLIENQITYKNKKIPLVDRQLVFGKSSTKFPKTILIFNQNNLNIGLEVD